MQDTPEDAALTPTQETFIRQRVQFVEKLLREGVTVSEAEELVNSGHFIDARKGGLVVGRPHEDAKGIGAFVTDSDGQRVRFHGYSLEGGEYVLTEAACRLYPQRIVAMKKYTWDEVTRYTAALIPSPDTPIIDATIRCADRINFVWVNRDQQCVNRRSTAEHLLELNEMNRATEP